MIVLGFDTATPSTSVALLGTSGEPLELRDDPRGSSRGEHSECVLRLARELLVQAELDWSALDLIAVGSGPGGYTGLRIGIATARGLALALGARLAGVCTLRALAQPVGAVTTLALLDGRRGELFAAAYADDAELLAPRVIRPEDLAATVAELDAPRVCAVGDGAELERARLEELGVEVAAADSPLQHVSAAAICAIAAREPTATTAPLYLRRPDAELALER